MADVVDGRAAFQVLVLPYRWVGGGLCFALFRRADAGYWQGVAGGGEAEETPLAAARREADEEAGLGDGEFVALDSRVMMPVVAVTGEFTWGPEVLVIPEYAFGVEATDRDLVLSDEHTEFGWFSFQEATKALRWDSNRTALWELGSARARRCGMCRFSGSRRPHRPA